MYKPPRGRFYKAYAPGPSTIYVQYFSYLTLTLIVTLTLILTLILGLQCKVSNPNPKSIACKELGIFLGCSLEGERFFIVKNNNN